MLMPCNFMRYLDRAECQNSTFCSMSFHMLWGSFFYASLLACCNRRFSCFFFVWFTQILEGCSPLKVLRVSFHLFYVCWFFLWTSFSPYQKQKLCGGVQDGCYDTYPYSSSLASMVQSIDCYAEILEYLLGIGGCRSATLT